MQRVQLSDDVLEWLQGMVAKELKHWDYATYVHKKVAARLRKEADADGSSRRLAKERDAMAKEAKTKLVFMKKVAAELKRQGKPSR